MISTKQSGAAAFTSYRGYRIAVYVCSDGSYGFSLFPGGGKPGQQVASVMNHMGLKSAADARALGRHAVDLALQPGVSGLDGFSFSNITSAFAKLGQGVKNNVGVLSTVGGAVLTATGVGAPAGIALATAGNAAQGAVSAKAEAKAAKKKAKADAAAAAAAAAGQDPAAAAAAVYAEDDDAPKKSSVLKWVAAGGGGLILLGTVAWALLRRKG